MLAINLTSIGYLSIISENFITRFRMIEYKGAVMRKFVSRDSKKDFYLLYTLVFGVILFLSIISLRVMGSLWCGVMMGFRSI
mgnify:FL=1